MPWKNGQGTTTEIAVEPAGAGLDAFTWRISIADIGGSGPFSIFPGVERILLQTEGEPMVLAHGDGEHEGQGKRHRLALLVPYRFAGEWPTTAEVPAPPVRDFNVMARRDRVQASTTVHELVRGTVARVSAAAMAGVVHAFRGALTVRIGGPASPEVLQIEGGDTVVVVGGAGAERGDGAVEIAAETGDAVAFVIAFS